MVELNLDGKTCFRISWLNPALAAINYLSWRLSPIGPSAPGPIAVRAKKGKRAASRFRKTTRSLLLKLPPDTEAFNHALVAGFIAHLDIVKQFAALADQLEQTTA